jgi:hypothetical protein
VTFRPTVASAAASHVRTSTMRAYRRPSLCSGLSEAANLALHLADPVQSVHRTMRAHQSVSPHQSGVEFALEEFGVVDRSCSSRRCRVPVERGTDAPQAESRRLDSRTGPSAGWPNQVRARSRRPDAPGRPAATRSLAPWRAKNSPKRARLTTWPIRVRKPHEFKKAVRLMGTPSTDAIANVLVDRLNERIGDWDLLPDGWHDDADLALVDTVFSTRARYDTTVLPLVRRWKDAPDRPPGRRLSSLTAAGREILASVVRNNQLVPGRSPTRLRKVDAVLDVAARIVAEGLDTPDQIRSRAAQGVPELRKLIQVTPGVGPAQSAYFLMLLGIQGVKADTLVSSWVESAVDSGALSQQQVEEVVTLAAASLAKDPILVDYAIWRAESTRRQGIRGRR